MTCHAARQLELPDHDLGGTGPHRRIAGGLRAFRHHADHCSSRIEGLFRQPDDRQRR